LNTGSTGQVSMKVFNLLGKVVYENESPASGLMQQTLNLEHLVNGVYFLKVKGDGVSIVKKIVKE